ncbi:hypothetical protein BKA69DRAFT_79159 [Paraphysoderma sedebokerense]|nr:hypothetical protein BKA69DRAFT_79159 [Paraphysoderma sedebokerense]
MPNRRLHCLCIFLQLIILAFFPFVGHVSALDKVTSPWYIQNDPIPLFLNPDAHILQTVKHENEYYIFTGLNNSNVIEIYRARNIDLRFSTVNSLATDTLSSSIISFWNISLSNWTFDPERRWSTISFTINPSTSLYRLYAVALSSTAGLRIQSYALGNRSSLSQQNYPIAGIENPHIVLDWKWGALMVGLYQHAPPTQSRSNISYIGAYTDEGRRIVEKYNYSRPFFLHSMALNSSASTNFYQITIVNDTHVTDLVPNSGQFTPSARSTQSLPDEHLIRGFPLYGYDISTNTSYYLSRRPRIDSTEIWLQKFNQNGIYLQHVTLPVNVTTSSKFQTDMKLSNGFIYAAVVTESTLLDCNRECGKAGQSELHLLQYNQTDLSLTSKLILATAGDNIISRIDIDNTTGALDMIWMSKDTVKRNTTLNYFRFSPFKISDVLVADSNSTRMTENSTLRIMFSVLPERLQLIKLTAVPTVYVGKKISPYVRWNNDSLEALVPRGVGTGMLQRVLSITLA